MAILAVLPSFFRKLRVRISARVPVQFLIVMMRRERSNPRRRLSAKPLLALTVTLGVAFGQTVRYETGPIISALKQDHYSEALRLTQAELSKYPTSPQLWTLRAMALSGLGETGEALRAYEHALKISPDYLAALEGVSQMLYKDQSQKAVPFLKHLVQLHPDDQVAHAMLGSLAFARGDCAAAIEQFENGRDQMETQQQAMLEYGACLAQLNQTEKSIRILQSLLAADSNNVVARRGLAAIQLKAEKPKDTIETLSPLLQARTIDSLTARLAAAAYEANQDTPRAVQILHDAIEQDPGNVDLYVDFANMAFAHQSFQAGVEMVSVGLKAQPGSAALYLARGVLYAQLAFYDKAEADFQKAEELDPHQAFSAAASGLMAEKGTAYTNQGLVDLRHKLAKNPNNAFLWSLEASLLSESAPDPGTPEFSEAMHAAQQAVKLDPGIASAYDVLAKLYEQTGLSDEAILQCRNALRNDPKDQTALYHLIMMLRKKDSKNEVPDLLKRLAQLRQEATRQEAERNRYKLIIASDASTIAVPGEHN
jgi:tetratricopeptide (TPR) repeat protein